MREYKPDPKSILTSLVVTLLITLLSLTLFWGVFFPKPSADSYVFTRITEELPSYSTSSSWIRVDRPDLHWEEDYIPDKIFEDAYERPIWIHPPLANILAWPFVKLVQLTSPSRIIGPDNERLLKVVPIIFFLLSLYLIGLTLRKTLKPWQILVCLSPIPIMTTALYGVPYFYHDSFMVLLLTLSIWLISKKSRWKYLVITLLVLTKSNAAIFLIPLAIWDRNWKIMLPGFGFLAYMGLTWSVTGHPLYVFEHWSTMSGYIRLHYEGFLSKNIGNAILYSGYYIYIPILIVSLIRAIRLRNKLYAPIFGIIGLLLASWAIIPYQMTPLLIGLPIMLSTMFKEPN